MLQLKNIKKSYTTAGFTQNALDGISVAFRDNEFAAVLGPSGSGKTTMLNVIGGLDRYESGDLEIDGISTKNYKASDWDTYRNNRIGFVFQSYNLIPHQNVLSNVELALTLSGVSKRERRQRAVDALKQVGLGEHMRKKPNQLSGGQMQRVAIARALINNPEILLADEPTGALDSKTSLQVMELLTKIAEDRCVIMVTHNNELAEQYANRLVHLTDGKVTSDSRPFDPEKEKQRPAAEPRRSRMSFWTAIALSFSNLMTKKGRTFTTAFAGSIGIIGIATILAFSNGINAYIRGIEEDTLSLYPLSIQQQSLDLSGFFGGGDDSGGEQGSTRRRERPEGTVREMMIMENVFSSQSLNDLGSLKKHIDGNLDVLGDYITTIDYTYNITPHIYISDTSKGVDRINPDTILSGAMGGADLPMVGGMGPAAMMNVFYELPNEPALYESQYEILTGKWPENYDEAVLVLPFGYRIMDYMLYTLGIRDRDEMRAMAESFLSGTNIETELSESEMFYPYEDLMISFKVINQAETYDYDETFEIWVDRSGDEEFMIKLLEKSMDLKIVGIAQPLEEASTTVLQPGVNYLGSLIYHLMDEAQKTPIVKEQLENPEVNVISGLTFEYERENPPNTFDFSRIISVDEDALREAMPLDAMMDAFDFESMDTSGLDLTSIDLSGLDLSGMDLSGLDFGSMDLGGIDLGGMDMSAMPPPEFDIGELTLVIASQVSIPPEAIDAMMNTAMAGLIPQITSVLPGLIMSGADEETINNAITAVTMAYFSDPNVQAALMAQLTSYIDPTVLEGQISAAVQMYMMTAMQGYMTQMAGAIEGQVYAMANRMAGQIQGAVGRAMSEMSATISQQMQRTMTTVSDQIEDTLAQLFEDMAAELEAAMDSFDADAMAEAFRIEMSEEAVFDLMSAMMNPTTTSYEQNLAMFGYADMEHPTQIMIYPRSFEAKEEVMVFLDDYNTQMERSGQPEKVVHFTDIVGMMMSSVTDIVDIVSYALIAFVSVALIVSSIMIGVITFVSVLERKKEIGILRAVGASRGNIRLVFNAETLIIGFVAGMIGVVVTYFIAIIANEIIWNLLNVRNLVLMPPEVPAILVAISMFLTFLAGLVPAQAAASRPPVEALRSE